MKVKERIGTAAFWARNFRLVVEVSFPLKKAFPAEFVTQNENKSKLNFEESINMTGF